MITDIHAHVTVDVPAQLTRARRAGVERTVLLSTRVHPEAATTVDGLRTEFGRLTAVVGGTVAPRDEFHAAAAELQHALDAHPNEVVGFVNVPWNQSEQDIRTWLDDHLARPNIVGIGEVTPPPDQGHTIEVAVAISADHGGVPVLVHGFAPNTLHDIRTYAMLAECYPTVPIIVGAFGGLHAMDLIDLAIARSNLYMDLSSALQVFVVRAAAHAVPEQCLFGSNTPYGDVVAARQTVEAAVADTGILALVLGDNFTRLLNR